jgi:YbgC/YbaW family acyl-CoA thioester hydrolase
MATPFRTSRRVEFVDTDMAGIVHFSNFFRYMEAAEVDFLRSLGLSVSMRTPEGTWLGFPRVSASCEFIRPARFLDVIDILVQVESVGQKSVTYRFEVEKDGAALARGQITAVCCRTVGNQLESFAIPDDIRAKLEQGMGK